MTLIKEVEIRHYVHLLATFAVLVAYGGAASAQAPSAQSPSVQQNPATQPTPGGPMMQRQDQTIRERFRLRERAQRDGEEDSDQGGYYYRGGMMGGGMIGREMMGRGYGYHGGDRGVMRSGMMGPPMMMRMIFSLMDADGDGKLSLQEFQAAHERIFKAMDANKDGFVTIEEMQNFIHGSSTPASQQ